MQSESDEPQGPALVVTTKYLRKGPRRIALRTKAVALPGTYQLSKVLGGGLGAAGAMLLSAPILLGFGIWQMFIVAGALGGLGGVFIVSWSPLRGESLARWFLLFSAKRRGLVMVGSRYHRAYVGSCPVDRPTFGRVQVVRSYTELRPATDPQPAWSQESTATVPDADVRASVQSPAERFTTAASLPPMPRMRSQSRVVSEWDLPRPPAAEEAEPIASR